jgi:AraC-like DNA-binding protein/quercetin dioxygenase-like cupin family protein
MWGMDIFMEQNNNHYTIRDQDFHATVRQYGHDTRTKSHSHDFFEIVFVTQGFSLHRVGEDVSILLPGDIFYIPPETSHEYWKSINNRVYNCLFYPDVFGEDLNALMKLPFIDRVLRCDTSFKWSKIHLKLEDRFEILGILKKLECETNEMPSGWEISSKSLLTDLLIRFSRVGDNSSQGSDPMDPGLAASALGMMHILEQSINNRMSIEQMAKCTGYSPEYFSRIFKKLTGITPSAYITSMRIATAAQELLESDTSVSRAAEIAGFDDVNYFSRLFKKETVKTPSEFRNMSNGRLR